jgi:hypothetical protein
MVGAVIDFQDYFALPQPCTKVLDAPPKRAALVVTSALPRGKRNAPQSFKSIPKTTLNPKNQSRQAHEDETYQARS